MFTLYNMRYCNEVCANRQVFFAARASGTLVFKEILLLFRKFGRHHAGYTNFVFYQQ